MPKVICKLDHASDEISGVKFTAVEGGKLSEEISDEQAARFASIPGYELVEEKKAPPPAPSAPVETAAPEGAGTQPASTPAPTPAPATGRRKAAHKTEEAKPATGANGGAGEGEKPAGGGEDDETIF